MHRIFSWLMVLSLTSLACTAQVDEGDPLDRYLQEGRDRSVLPEAREASKESESVEPEGVVEAPQEGEERPFFDAYLGEHRYDVYKDVLIPFKGGRVVYRFRRVDDAEAYPGFDSYLRFEFQIVAVGPGRLFLDEARFVAHCVYDEPELVPRRFSVGLRDGSFRHLKEYRIDASGETMTIVDRTTGQETQHPVRHDDTVDPVTFFFNLFCLGVDLGAVEEIRGHLLHENQTPIQVKIDPDERVARVEFEPGEFLPRRSCAFRFFFDEKGVVEVDRFELDYGSWSMRMERIEPEETTRGEARPGRRRRG